MVSSIVDKKKLLAMLDVPATQENARSLQTGAFLLLLNAYDRKVTRQNFKVYLSTALQVYDAVGRLSVITNMRRFKNETGAITMADIMQAEQGCEALVKVFAAECLKLAGVLAQCPEDEDPVS